MPYPHAMPTPFRLPTLKTALRRLNVIVGQTEGNIFRFSFYAITSKLDSCTVWNAHDTVFVWKRSAICAQAVYFLHSTMPSITCLRLSDVSVICRVTYFQFLIQSAFLPYRSQGSTAAYVVYPVSDIRRCRKFGKCVSCMPYSPGKWLWIDSNGKRETKHPVKSYFGIEFRAICNYCGVMAAWSRK